MTRGTRAGDLLLAVAVAVQAAAITAWPRVVTVDGPAHLAGAYALLHGGEGSQALYDVDLSPVPNLLTGVVLAALLTVLGPDGAERLLVLGYAVGLPLAMRYALRGVDPQAGWLAVVAVPFVGGYLYAYGFYNFCLGLVGLLLVAGVALRRRDGWSAGPALGVAVLLVLTWTAHLLPLMVALVLVAVLALCRAYAGRGDGWRAVLGDHLVPPALLALPVLALTVAFSLTTAGTRGEPVRVSGVGALLLGLLDLGRPLVAWTTWEYAGSALVALGLAVLAVQARRRPASPDRTALALTAVGLLGWYVVSPDRYGPAYGLLNDRLSLFPPLVLTLWAAGPPPTARAGRAAVAVLLAGAVALVGVRLPTEVRFQREVGELLSVAPQVPRGSTIAAVRLVRTGPVGPDARNTARDPLRHQAGRIAVLRDGVDVGHYQAVTPYFPVRWSPATDPRRSLEVGPTGLELVPPFVDLAAGPQVVLLVGRDRAEPAVLAQPSVARVLAQLEAGYRRAAVSSRSGLVEVWLRR